MITLVIERGYNYVSLRVTNTGKGIRECDQGRIFNHGFSIKSKGHGFGLHACANAMAEMGGTIRLDKAYENEGTSFVLRFALQKA